MQIHLLTAAFALTLVQSSFGWAGGPWSNNTPQELPNDGTYSAVVRGPNMTGVLLFSTGVGVDDEGTVSGTGEGICSIFFRGEVARGNVAAMSDVAGRKIFGHFDASVIRAGEVSINNDLINPGGNVSISANDVLYVGGGFVADIESTFPVLRFEGDGVAEFQEVQNLEEAAPTVANESVAFTISGIRVLDTVVPFVPVDTELPFVNVPNVTLPETSVGGGGTVTFE